jgi:hypothetical protein
MNKNPFLWLFIAIFFLLFPHSPSALEITALGNLGNLFFDTGRTASLQSANLPFQSNLAFWGTLSAEEALSDTLRFSASFENDPLLRNRVYTRIGFDGGFVKLSVGPFFGPFNTADSILTSGLSTTLRLELPGFVFGSFRSDSTIGAGISAPGDYVQERSEIAIGFWVPHVITTLRIASDSFTEKQSATLNTKDNRTRYELIAEVYKKNVPYTAKVHLGFQSLSRSYIGTLGTSKDELGDLFVGLDLNAQVSEGLSILAGVESPIYAWGIRGLASPSSSTILYEVKTGVVYTFPKNIN